MSLIDTVDRIVEGRDLTAIWRSLQKQEIKGKKNEKNDSISLIKLNRIELTKK